MHLSDIVSNNIIFITSRGFADIKILGPFQTQVVNSGPIFIMISAETFAMHIHIVASL